MTTYKDTREMWLRTYVQLEARGEAFKDSQSVAFGLLDAYDALSLEERSEVIPILADWLLSEDDKHRYDATFLATERHIRELIPAIANAIENLQDIPGPEAKYEVKGLVRLLEDLS